MNEASRDDLPDERDMAALLRAVGAHPTRERLERVYRRLADGLVEGRVFSAAGPL